MSGGHNVNGTRRMQRADAIRRRKRMNDTGVLGKLCIDRSIYRKVAGWKDTMQSSIRNQEETMI